MKKDKKIIQLPIGGMFPSVGQIESLKGKSKQNAIEQKELIQEFLNIASEYKSDCDWLTATEQRVCSVKFQTRKSIDKAELLKLITPEQLESCMVESAPSGVYRIH
jgi:hypothetical protein